MRSQTNTYVLNGSATQNSCNCYTLTRASNAQSGSVWNATKINLTQSFDFSFNVFLGCTDANGADGIVFILQTIATSVGTPGGGLGFAGVVPSIGIALDTWQNTDLNDPPEDHISIQSNGGIVHGADLAGPVSILPGGGNVEDCQWHVFRISWDPSTKFLRAFFDGNMRVEAQVDLITTIFNNNPGVYWGFSAATGGANNLQQFCTALNPGFTTDLTGNATCIGNSTVVFTNSSVSFAPIDSYYWNFGDGQTTTVADPPAHVYTAPGLYTAQLAIIGLDGCKSDTLEKVIAVGDAPVASFEIFDTCAGSIPRIVDHSSVSVGTITQWNWLLDNVPSFTAQAPQLSELAPGPHTLQLSVASNYGCSPTIVAQKQFFIKQTPTIDGKETGACISVPVLFNGLHTDNVTIINNWSWDFGDNHSAVAQNTSHTYMRTGSFTATLMAIADNGCRSNKVNIPFTIVQAVANAGNDTMIVNNKSFQLHGTGGSVYNWSPPTGINDPSIADPVISISDDAAYTLTVTTAEGCIDEDDIKITVFKGSNIYVPNAFTPDGNGLNETLAPYYIGIKKLSYFNVFNRWGQAIFTTQNVTRGWDGTINGVKQATGVYVWQLKAVDYVGKVYQLNGTFTLIR
ncbi:MAG: PKD domain-containing protein [Chitinophagaceae bacterium]